MNNVTEAKVKDTLPAATADKLVIDVRNLQKSFGKQEILKDISLQLGLGENLVVLGKSGSGKSVLIKCLVGLLRPDNGSITILDQDVTSLQRKELNQLRQKIGFLFQGGALYDSMTVKQNIEFPLRRIKKGLTEKEIAAKVHEVLENVDLVDALHKMPADLSGGMRKRISLARTIVVDPQIMLYDEPTTGLDPITSDEISSLIMDVQKKYKTSSLIITHDIKCALHTANRMIMIKDGTVFKEGKPEEFTQSTDEFIRSFSFQ
jgi:phospholipid/cholesterol/gamma-HCH transport system ATP-binding protein